MTNIASTLPYVLILTALKFCIFKKMLLKIHQYVMVSDDLEWSSQYPACSCLNYNWKCNVATKHHICFEIGNEWVVEERYRCCIYTVLWNETMLKRARTSPDCQSGTEEESSWQSLKLQLMEYSRHIYAQLRKNKLKKTTPDFIKIIFQISYFSKQFYIRHWRGT